MVAVLERTKSKPENKLKKGYTTNIGYKVSGNYPVIPKY